MNQPKELPVAEKRQLSRPMIALIVLISIGASASLLTVLVGPGGMLDSWLPW